MTRIPRLRRFFRHDRADVDLEMQFHIESRAEDLARLGVDRAQAHRQALAEFGDLKRYHAETTRIDRERAREVHMKEFFGSIGADFAYAMRGLRRSPGFTLVAVVTLAIGIGATVAVFSVVSGAILRPLPFTAAERIVHVGEREIAQPGMGQTTSAENAYDWQRMSTSFAAFGLYSTFSMTLTGSGEPLRVEVANVTPGMFDVFQIAPLLGRRIVDTDTVAGARLVAVVSHDFWRSKLGGDQGAVGRVVQMNFTPVEIVGVLPPGFHGPQRLDRPVWLNFINDTSDARAGRSKNVFALLKPGITRERAQQEMTTIARELERIYPQFNKDMTVAVNGLDEMTYGRVERPLFLLLGASALVLLIACANISNLLVARGIARGREMAMRAALGAGRARLVRQMLTESALLATVGVLLGVGLAAAATRTLGRLGPDIFDTRPPVLDERVLAFCVVIAVLSTALFGLLPAARATRGALFDTLRMSGRVIGAGGIRTRSGLALVQLALSVILLTASALLLKSFARVLDVDPGVRTSNVLYADVWLPRFRYDSSKSTAFYQELERRLLVTPGVVSVGMTSQVPLSGYFDRISISRIGGRPRLTGAEAPEADRYVVTPSYFATMGVRLLKGRLLSSDDRFETTPVAVVDEIFARRAFGDADPIGQTMKLPIRQELATVVGVVTHVKTYGLDIDAPGQIYMSNAQYPWRWLSVIVHTKGAPHAFAGTLARVVQSLDQDQPVANVTTLQDALARLLKQRRFTMFILGAFAATAIVLAAIGLYGVIAYGVTQRRRELGVRVALGAQATQIGRLVLSEGLRIAVAAAVIGSIGAVAAGRMLSSLLYDVSPNDPLVLAGVAAGLLAVALMASMIPARRAMSVDAAEILRGD